MAKTAAKKQYTVIIHRKEKTAEEAEALRKKQAAVLLDAKLKAMERRA